MKINKITLFSVPFDNSYEHTFIGTGFTPNIELKSLYPYEEIVLDGERSLNIRNGIFSLTLSKSSLLTVTRHEFQYNYICLENTAQELFRPMFAFINSYDENNSMNNLSLSCEIDVMQTYRPLNENMNVMIDQTNVFDGTTDGNEVTINPRQQFNFNRIPTDVFVNPIGEYRSRGVNILWACIQMVEQPFKTILKKVVDGAEIIVPFPLTTSVNYFGKDFADGIYFYFPIMAVDETGKHLKDLDLKYKGYWGQVFGETEWSTISKLDTMGYIDINVPPSEINDKPITSLLNHWYYGMQNGIFPLTFTYNPPFAFNAQKIEDTIYVDAEALFTWWDASFLGNVFDGELAVFPPLAFMSVDRDYVRRYEINFNSNYYFSKSVDVIGNKYRDTGTPNSQPFRKYSVRIGDKELINDDEICSKINIYMKSVPNGVKWWIEKEDRVGNIISVYQNDYTSYGFIENYSSYTLNRNKGETILTYLSSKGQKLIGSTISKTSSMVELASFMGGSVTSAVGTVVGNVGRLVGDDLSKNAKDVSLTDVNDKISKESSSTAQIAMPIGDRVLVTEFYPIYDGYFKTLYKEYYRYGEYHGEMDFPPKLNYLYTYFRSSSYKNTQYRIPKWARDRITQIFNDGFTVWDLRNINSQTPNLEYIKLLNTDIINYRKD